MHVKSNILEKKLMIKIGQDNDLGVGSGGGSKTSFSGKCSKSAKNVRKLPQKDRSTEGEIFFFFLSRCISRHFR